MPSEHTWPAGQTVPQPPQCAGSLRVSTHRPPHSACPAGQAQRPATHEVPPVQVVPHAPQWPLELRRSTQLPPQSVSPAGHMVVQRPALHT
jgi:hypothetical protein